MTGRSARELVTELQARYAPLVRPVTERPRVVAQLGQSLDGRIATPTGHSHYVTGEADRAHLHRLRALCDAVLVGAGTVVADDPRLTVRAVEGPNPTRVVVMSRDDLAPRRHLFEDGAAPTWAVTGPTAVPPPVDRHFSLPELSPAAVLECLSAAGIRRLLVEGGAQTVSAWLAAGLVDSLYLAVAPVIIGSGPTGLNLPVIEHMDQAWRPAVEAFDLGVDRLYRLDFTVAEG
ncbi:RibD family protein [Spiribacter vilamensis]|uniref:Riboflavin-specific deaminase-like protein n=1 Tax=Spiribacter vilamensis TaxID=531306 RepID=A0A4Q8CYK9_9GAMM|nr:RibD family protein [Spiribacter vilamensis]RZU98068.1 riboflavin-specific deaminase-like protein [Spiribacter vilamensis]